MNLGLFKELCCFLLFRAISCKMAWSLTYKASFRSFSFKLLPSEKLPFFLSESVVLFSCIMSFLSKIFFEIISFFLWTGTIFLIALYLQIFSPAIVFEFAMDLINFRKKFSLVAELFTSTDMPPPHLTLVASPALMDSTITLIPWKAYSEKDCNPTIPLYS